MKHHQPSVHPWDFKCFCSSNVNLWISPHHPQHSIENTYILWDKFRVTLRKSYFWKSEESSSERQWTPGMESLTLFHIFTTIFLNLTLLILNCVIGTDYNQKWLIISKLHSHLIPDCAAMPVTLCAGRYLSTCVRLCECFQHSSWCCCPAAESDARTYSLTSGCGRILQEDLGSRLNDILWCGCNPRLNYGFLNQNQEMGPGVCLKLMKNKQTNKNLQLDEWFFSSFSYFIFTTVGTQTSTSLSLGCDKQGSVCPCVRRVHYQVNPSPSVLSTSPKVYSRAGRAAQRKASFFRPSWLEAKGQRYLRLWLLCSFCLAPPIEDRKWAWRELNTAPSRFSSPCGGYSHRKVKLSDKEKQQRMLWFYQHFHEVDTYKQHQTF